MPPTFILKLVYPDGTALPFYAGSGFERDMIAACKKAIVAKGVGLFVTEAQVATAIEDGMTEALMALKLQARQLL